MTATLLTLFLFSLKHSSMLRTENECKVLGARAGNTTLKEDKQVQQKLQETNLILKAHVKQ